MRFFVVGGTVIARMEVDATSSIDCLSIHRFTSYNPGLPCMMPPSVKMVVAVT